MIREFLNELKLIRKALEKLAEIQTPEPIDLKVMAQVAKDMKFFNPNLEKLEEEEIQEILKAKYLSYQSSGQYLFAEEDPNHPINIIEEEEIDLSGSVLEDEEEDEIKRS